MPLAQLRRRSRPVPRPDRQPRTDPSEALADSPCINSWTWTTACVWGGRGGVIREGSGGWSECVCACVRRGGEIDGIIRGGWGCSVWGVKWRDSRFDSFLQNARASKQRGSWGWKIGAGRICVCVCVCASCACVHLLVFHEVLPVVILLVVRDALEVREGVVGGAIAGVPVVVFAILKLAHVACV